MLNGLSPKRVGRILADLQADLRGVGVDEVRRVARAGEALHQHIEGSLAGAVGFRARQAANADSRPSDPRVSMDVRGVPYDVTTSGGSHDSPERSLKSPV